MNDDPAILATPTPELPPLPASALSTETAVPEAAAEPAAPSISFADLGLNADVLRALTEMGFRPRPTRSSRPGET